MNEEEIINEILEFIGVSSIQELGTQDVFKAIENNFVSYNDAICFGLIDDETVIEEIGTEKAIAEGILTETEAIQWEKETQELKRD